MNAGRALITGGGGQLATELEASLDGEVLAPSRAELDVTDDDAVARTIADFSPEVVFNCAAFHNVDACETEPEPAFAVNAIAVGRLAARCAEAGAKLVHLSTNYVFDGDREEPYAEHDAPNPRSVYAISKLAGEYAALAYAPNALVVRTAGLYGGGGGGSQGANFITKIVARAREDGRLRMVADQRLSPTYTADLAPVLVEAAERGVDGVIHLTSSGACSWLEFTAAIMELAGIDVAINPVTKSTGPGLADRPLNGVLSRPAADAAGLETLRPWREALEDYMRAARLAAAPQPS